MKLLKAITTTALAAGVAIAGPAQASLDGAWRQQNSSEQRAHNAEMAFCFNLHKSAQWAMRNVPANVYSVGPDQKIYVVTVRKNPIRINGRRKDPCVYSFQHGYLNREYEHGGALKVKDLFRNENGHLIRYRQGSSGRIYREVIGVPIHVNSSY